MDKPFRKPEDMRPRGPTEPVSTRIRVSAKKTLEKAAEKQGESLAWLVAQVLEDYARWLEGTKK